MVRLVLAVLGEIRGLILTPLRWMARELDPFIDRKRRHAHTRQAEMVRTVIVSGFGPRVWPDRQMKIPRRRLHHRIKRRPLRATHFHFFRSPQWRDIVEIPVHHDFSPGEPRMFFPKFPTARPPP